MPAREAWLKRAKLDFDDDRSVKKLEEEEIGGVIVLSY